jgi:hypothetical protein
MKKQPDDVHCETVFAKWSKKRLGYSLVILGNHYLLQHRSPLSLSHSPNR